MRLRRLIPGITAAALLLGSCARERDEAEAPFVFPIPIDTGSVTVQAGATSERLLVEIARTDEQKRLGLGLRPSLDPGSGMIFPYDSVQPGEEGYWMRRMRIPIDIAFVDSAGAIIEVFPNVPICEAVYREGCPSYAPEAPYWSVLETNQGWFAEHGFGPGAVVTLED